MNSLALRVIHYVTLAVIIISLIVIFIVAPESNTPYWIVLFVGIIVEAAALALIKRNDRADAKRERDSMTKFFFTGITGIIVIMIIIGIWGAYALSDTAYRAVALVIMVLWACVFLGYFVWAVYFYNVNLGLTQEEWNRIDESKRKKAAGEHYLEADIKEEPKYNPYDDQTFGLPPGTVRGMIAFTLLFGGISTLIMSIGTKDCLECQSTFRDQFDFFKNAFLMMIAFYFGSRSLEILSDKSTGKRLEDNTGAEPEEPEPTGLPANDPDSGNAGPPINPMDPQVKPAPSQPKVVTTDTGSAKPADKNDDIVFINPMEKRS